MDPALSLPVLLLDDKKKQSKIVDILSNVVVNKERQEKIQEIFLTELSLGLMKNPPKASSITMVNTYVEELINGTEEGEFLALDLGSTNFRVIFIILQNGKIINEMVEYYDVPEEKKHGHGRYLFEFLATCIADFVWKKSLQDKHLKLGFTFSMPMLQTSINKASLNCWTKNFSCPGVVGEDVVAMLQMAINQENLNVNVIAILNDATGTLVQGSYLDKRCAIGLILGTGHNGCYFEKASNIGKWEGDHSPDQEVIINMECGSFGDNGTLDFIRTQWDDVVDQKSLFKKSYTFEKYFSGRFLGDIVREALVTLSENGLFAKKSKGLLEKEGSLLASDVASIERDAFAREVKITDDILIKLGIHGDKDDALILQYVSGLFSYRGVLLVSILSGVLLNRMKKPHCTIAIDGSLYEKHPRYKPLLYHLISKFASDHSFSLLLAKDGSGKGAGLVAAVEDRRARTQTSLL